MACVYGDFTPRLAERVRAGEGRLDVVDVLPIQLQNLERKLAPGAPVQLLQGDASRLREADGAYDRVILFFLLHEMPLEVRQRTLGEALRVVKPGGQVVIVDYHAPRRWHPLRGVMRWILRNFEPFAMDLWANEIEGWLPAHRVAALRKETFYGGLYQRLVITAR